jgi:hypothetical protein
MKLKKKLTAVAASTILAPLGAAVNATINYGTPDEVEKMSDFFILYLNQETGGGWLAALGLISFGVPFMMSLEYGAKEAFSAGSFSFLIAIIMLSAFGLKGVGVYFAVGALAAVTAMIINNNSRGVAG